MRVTRQTLEAYKTHKKLQDKQCKSYKTNRMCGFAVCLVAFCLSCSLVERECEALSYREPHMRTPEIKKSSEINDLENELGNVWGLPEISGTTRDDS